MAWQWSALRSSKTIAGAVLVGFGMFVLYENLAAAAAWLRHVRSEALGVVPAAILEVSQEMQAYTTDSQRFLQALLRHMVLSSWPLLLIVAGTVLSRNKVTDNRSPETRDRRGRPRFGRCLGRRTSYPTQLTRIARDVGLAEDLAQDAPCNIHTPLCRANVLARCQELKHSPAHTIRE
jgi:hypothetical protein